MSKLKFKTSKSETTDVEIVSNVDIELKIEGDVKIVVEVSHKSFTFATIIDAEVEDIAWLYGCF